MAPETIITLYDIPTVGGIPTSPFTWKARYSLNFKGIPYKTVWLESPDIEPTMRRIGAAPTGTRPDGRPRYTVPVIVDPSRLTPSGGLTVVSDSFNIARYLDDVYPSPSLLLPQGTKALHALFRDHFTATVMMPFLPGMVPYTWHLFHEVTQIHLRPGTEAMLGDKIENVCPKGSEKWDEAWLKLRKGLTGVAALLDENGSTADGFVTGKQPTSSDFVVAAYLEVFVVAHPEEWHTEVCTWDGGRWGKLRDMCAEWRSVH